MGISPNVLNMIINIGLKHDFLCTNICWALREALKHLNLNLPGTPYTSRRVLHGVRVEMAEKKKKKKKKKKERVITM